MKDLVEQIEGTNGAYLISSSGKIFSTERVAKFERNGKEVCKSLCGKEIKQVKSMHGYLCVGLSVNGKRMRLRVHRLVMLAFQPTQDSAKLDVNHKNGIKTDNRLENLEWCTRGENLKHRYRVLKQSHSMAGKFGSHHHRSIPVVGISVKGDVVTSFDALMDAERQGYRASKISQCLIGKRKTHAGLRWIRSEQKTNLTPFI